MAPIRVMLAESGISEQKWRVLRVLAESGPMEQTALAERACLLLPSLTRMLRAMEEEGLASRAPDARDGRKWIVTVTEKGMEVLDSHAEASAAIFADLEKRFGSRRLEDLLDLLEALTVADEGRSQPRT